MTYEESLVALDALYAKHGRDYVVHAGNHPEILRAWNDKAVGELEAEVLARDEITSQ